jgi:hypothetical protein
LGSPAPAIRDEAERVIAQLAAQVHDAFDLRQTHDPGVIGTARDTHEPPRQAHQKARSLRFDATITRANAASATNQPRRLRRSTLPARHISLMVPSAPRQFLYFADPSQSLSLP